LVTVATSVRRVSRDSRSFAKHPRRRSTVIRIAIGEACMFRPDQRLRGSQVRCAQVFVDRKDRERHSMALFQSITLGWRGVAIAALLALSLGSCHKASTGKECDTCTVDEDCTESTLVCVPFSDGTKHCGSGLGSTQCRVPVL
jgi:hypothetical protein